MSDIRPFPRTTEAGQAPSHEVPLQATSVDIWQQKYCLRDQQGRPVDRDIEATYERVARAIAAVEAPKYPSSAKLARAESMIMRRRSGPAIRLVVSPMLDNDSKHSLA